MKNIFTANINGLEQRIHLFDKPVDEKDVRINFIGNSYPNKEELLEKDKNKFPSEAIYIPNWRELAYALDIPNILLVSPNNFAQSTDPSHDASDLSAVPSPENEINPKNLDVIVVSSYNVQAVRKGFDKSITPMGLQGLMLTADNKYVFGVRGGEVDAGLACVSPCGNLTREKGIENPIFDNYYVESLEELGINKDHIENIRLLGYQTDPKPFRSVNFILFSEAPVSSKILKDLHNSANNVYKEAKAKGMSEQEARAEIKKKGFQNIEAWEHDDLIFVENDRDYIKSLVDSREVINNKIKYKIKDVGRGPLIAYLHSRNL